jgi:di/tricarboxylate transporter
MTPQIAITLGILLVAVFLLITERFRSDLIALLVLLSLALTGLVTPAEAFSGFSNPAVVTIWAMFILSAGLARTGVANWLGGFILRFGKKGEARLIAAIMLLAALLSGFMSSTGIVAMLLPVISYIAKRTKIHTSRLLMPLAFGTLLGGVNTLISTPSNLLVSNALQGFRGVPFHFFDFLKAGFPVTLAGIAFMVVFGRRLLPKRDLANELGPIDREAGSIFGLEERLFALKLPSDSLLAGKSLAESRLGTALKLNVIGVIHKSKTQLAPGPNTLLQGGDQLLVLGKPDWLEELISGQTLVLESDNRKGSKEKDIKVQVKDLVSPQIAMLEVSLPETSPLVGQSLSQLNFRKQYQANVLALWHGDKAVRTNFQDVSLSAGDRLLVQASRVQLNKLVALKDFEARQQNGLDAYQLEQRLLLMTVPEHSRLDGKTLAESELADAFGLSVLGIIRKGKTKLMPKPKEKLGAGDQLVVEGKVEDVELLRAMRQLEIENDHIPALSELESEDIGLVEVVIDPHSNLGGKNLRDIEFREKYGLNVLAIWRGGRAYRSNLREMPLHIGDSLLVYGHRNRIKLLAKETQFLVLSQELQEAPKREKALPAALIMIAVVASVALGWLPIAIAAVAGAALMVVVRCINMEEAQKSIQWPVVFLIAGMLPLGIAMQNSGAAAWLGRLAFSAAGGWDTTKLLAILFITSNLFAQVIPPPVVAVLMSSIVLNVSTGLAASPQALLLTVAMASAIPMLSPVSHPANLLVMGSGGYRFTDYTKVGLPLTVLILLITVVAMPYYWPLH